MHDLLINVQSVWVILRTHQQQVISLNSKIIEKFENLISTLFLMHIMVQSDFLIYPIVFEF